ncbi:MAG: hypothetical protein ACIARQ_03410 [Phycisphaerales bacterium JB061]
MRWIVLAVLGSLMVGCSAKHELSADAPAKGLELGVMLPAEGMLSAELLYSDDPIVARYQRFQGGSSKPATRRTEMRVATTEEGWRVTWWHMPRRSTGKPTFMHALALQRGGDGSVLASSGFGKDKKHTIVFDPPVRVSPALMESGDKISTDFQARYVRADGEQKGTGPSRTWTEYAGRQRIATPMGPFDADVVLTSWEIDFGVGKLKRDTRTWIATVLPGRTTIVAQDIYTESDFLWWTGKSRLRLAIEAIVR